MKTPCQTSYNTMVSTGKVLYVLVAMVFWAWAICGCEQTDPTSGYTTKSLYRNNVKTVFVEQFDSQSFRRGVEYELTRAIVTQLELHSPYKVMSDRSQADTILYGSITGITERVLTQQRQVDRPIENQLVLSAEVTWKDLRSGAFLMDHRVFQVSGEYVKLLAAGEKSAVKQAANEMAARIVEDMETPWWE